MKVCPHLLFAAKVKIKLEKDINQKWGRKEESPYALTSLWIY